MRLLLRLLRLAAIAATLGLGLITVLALLGFASPELDLLNHFQVFWFPATLLALAAVLAFVRGPRARPAMIAAGVVGALASGITYLPEFISGLDGTTSPARPGKPVITVLTHNLFGLNYDMDGVAAMIRSEDPDIIAFQEYFSEQSSELDPLLAERYPYSARCRGGKRANLGLYSKLPFVEAEGSGLCPDNAYGSQRTAQILAQFSLAEGGGFSVLTTHLDWPVPVQRQVQQFADLAASVNAIEGPLLVVGDFNSTPWSYALRRFESATGMTRHTRNLVTYPLRFTMRMVRGLVDTPPFLPLDQALSRGGMTVHEVRAAAATASDHLPVVVKFSLD
jgi:endonuclease/exonuclease/phosphatase (EEP) superfamily protein YafD